MGLDRCSSLHGSVPPLMLSGSWLQSAGRVACAPVVVPRYSSPPVSNWQRLGIASEPRMSIWLEAVCTVCPTGAGLAIAVPALRLRIVATVRKNFHNVSFSFLRSPQGPRPYPPKLLG